LALLPQVIWVRKGFMAANPSMFSFSKVVLFWSFLLDAPAVCGREYETLVLRFTEEDLAAALGGT
jgi:hypothetical protein